MTEKWFGHIVVSDAVPSGQVAFVGKCDVTHVAIPNDMGQFTPFQLDEKQVILAFNLKQESDRG